MDYLLSLLLSFLLLYKYVAIFAAVFLSGLLLPLPTNTLLLAAGAFASQGYMDAGIVFATALIANVLGDSAGYALTRIWGTRFVTAERLKRFKVLERIDAFVHDHARLTIVVTRFMGTPAVVVNFIAGLTAIPYRRFVTYDVIGNALDTAAFLAIGYTLGVYTENISDIAQIAGWILLVVALIFVIYRLFIHRDAAAE